MKININKNIHIVLEFQKRLIIAVVICLFVQVSNAAMKTSVSQYGITWTFDKVYETGNFANGDFWVVGPLTITSITPVPANGMNGFMVNPGSGYDPVTKKAKANQAYDNRFSHYDSRQLPRLPLSVQKTSSIISSISDPDHCCNTGKAGWLKTAAVLTVVTRIPAAGSFRPAIRRGYKNIFFQVII